MASSSRNVERWKYDVFLSFRGTLERNTFVAHLHERLCDKRMNVFIDNELQRGEVITKAILDAIEESRISIVVISQNFASSAFCLDELVKILECRESIEQIVIPIFYQVDPEDVEKQKGDFGKEFFTHKGPFSVRRLLSNFFTNVSEILIWPYSDDLDEQSNNDAEATTNADCLQKWRSNLSAVTGLSGYPFTKGENESNFIKEIVKKVSKRLKQKPLRVAEYPVGLASRVDIILHKLNMESTNYVRMVGLHGMIKVGKTTTAKALYNKLLSQFEFDGCCFLSNVGERARTIQELDQLQQALLTQR